MESNPQSPTVRQVISDVRNDLHAVNLDDWIPAKYIHHKLLDAARLFIKRDGDEMRFRLYPSVWLTINEFEMEQRPLIGCCDVDIPKCDTVMISKLKLPEIFQTRFGYLLSIRSLDYDRAYTQLTPEEYAATQSRRYKDPNKRYFWIYNGHLVIPNCHVEAVILRAVFCNKIEGLKIDACREPDCLRLLDQEFTVPGYLLDDVKSYTVQKLASIRDRIPPSEYPHLNLLEKKSPVSK